MRRQGGNRETGVLAGPVGVVPEVDAAGAGRGLVLRKAIELLLLNLGLLAVYRAAFVWQFARAPAPGDVLLVFGRGLRLDAALLACEATLVALLAVLVPRLRQRGALAVAWGLTGMNLLALACNLLFFHERSQPLWEMLLANVDRISQAGIALQPFVIAHPLVVALLLALPVALAMVARGHLRGVAPGDGRPVLAVTPLLILGLCGALTFLFGHEYAVTKEGEQKSRIRVIASKRHMRFADYAMNQAVVNPVLDFAEYYLPSVLSRPRYRLESGEALAGALALLGLRPDSDAYPLLRRITGDPALRIRNVVLVQVEGLGTSILERLEQGRPVMPYLRQLGSEGLVFPNVYQSFSATDGSVFATTTSLHRAFSDVDAKSHFFPFEYGGLHGSLPRILGGDANAHYFFAGFRQRIDEFVAFTANQGYVAFGYEEVLARLGPESDTTANTLGIFDDVLLREAGDVILAERRPFTVQIMTGTSHSPWEVPAWFEPPGGLSPELATFAYVDEGLRRLVERLRAELPAFDQTLFVITGDHTSITFTGELGERLRVPLVLYSTGLARVRSRWADRQTDRASHVDILPTVLSLLEGEHPYAGMGRSLLTEPQNGAGMVSSGHHESVYVKDGFALRYTTHDGEAELFRMDGERILPGDVADDHPDVTRRLEREYLALYETANRLTREGRVFPRAAQGQVATAP